MLFRAKIALRSVCDITPQLLEKLGVCGLLLDIDNTLTTHDNPVPAAGVEAWVAGMQAAGISLCLVIFTDVLGANLFGVPCIFVFPMEMEKTRFFRFKRRMEIPFLPKKIYEENKELN